MQSRKAIIIGAGPAGLTAAHELQDKTDIIPLVFEMSPDIGGISKTVNYKENRIDIGGHRFFSKSDRVMDFWKDILPIQGAPSRDDILLDRKIPLSKDAGAPDPESTDRVMLFRQRLSRILFLGKFFDYPISLSPNTVLNLGFFRMMKIGFSYIRCRLFPVKPERSLEDFFINRFGRELYKVFFKDYTEKVWGVPCTEIRPEWGAQRVKGLSIMGALLHAVKVLFKRDVSIEQKDTETSLIGQFLYPKFGPGQLWEEVADLVQQRGGEVQLNHRVTALELENRQVVSVTVENLSDGTSRKIEGDYVFSSMPVKDLIRALGDPVPEDVREVAEGLMYRDFMTAGLLLKRLKIKNTTKISSLNQIVPDNWIYIQEPDVKVGRLQILNNWSPYMVKDPDTVWIACEYFCNEGDALWTSQDEDFIQLAIREMEQINMIDRNDVLDAVAVRMPKTYPAYFGTYDRFHTIQTYTDQIENLFLVGRNGMHRYNNQDHSMLTSMVAVENIQNNILSKANIWDVNTEQDYHEES